LLYLYIVFCVCVYKWKRSVPRSIADAVPTSGNWQRSVPQPPANNAIVGAQQNIPAGHNNAIVATMPLLKAASDHNYHQSQYNSHRHGKKS
jgi:hypothetical protein